LRTNKRPLGSPDLNPHDLLLRSWAKWAREKCYQSKQIKKRWTETTNMRCFATVPC
jgi:hypothetical protein